MDPIRIVIADDEPPARAKIRRFLTGGGGAPGDLDVTIVAEAASGLETIEAVERTRPDLLFLDVQMPEPDGFGVLAALDPDARPHVIFTTAYDEYAVRAFEVHAVDYLLKPFDEERFRRAFRRAVEVIGRGGVGSTGEVAGWPDALRRLIDEAQTRGHPLERILVRRGETATLLRTDEIIWIEAAGNYSRLHTAAGPHLIRCTLAGLEARLDPARFARIHRSHIVNLDQIRSLHPWSHGDWLVRLHDGTELMLSRRFRDRLPFDGL